MRTSFVCARRRTKALEIQNIVRIVFSVKGEAVRRPVEDPQRISVAWSMAEEERCLLITKPIWRRNA